MSAKMIVSAVSNNYELLKLSFEDSAHIELVASRLQSWVRDNAETYAAAEVDVFDVHVDRKEIVMHVSTFMRINQSLWSWAAAQYRHDPMNFPRLVVHDDFKSRLQSLVSERLISIDLSLKDNLELLKALKSLGIGLKQDLYEHQLHRIKEFAFHGVKADCSIMGSGKSAVAIANYALQTNCNAPLLVLCPLNALVSWREELATWAPDLRVFTVTHGVARGEKGSYDRRSILNELAKNPHVIVVNYDKLHSVGPVLLRHYLPLGIKLALMCDEAHKLKNQSSRNYLSVQRILPVIHSQLRWAATGTPMPRDENDLQSLVQLLTPSNRRGELTGRVRDDFTNIMTFVRPSVLGLPPMQEHFVYVDMYERHAELYRAICMTTLKDIERYGSDITLVERCIQRVLMYLSYPANENLHRALPHIFREIQDYGHGAKIDKLLELVGQKLPSGKIVVWTNWVHSLNHVFSLFEALGYNPARIDGTVNGNDRVLQIKKFKEDDTCKIMIANPRAGGEAISLHKISTCAIFLDLTYNFAHKFQAEKRIHRCGLSADANVETYYIVATCNGRQTLDGSLRTEPPRGVLANLSRKKDEHDLLMESAEGVMQRRNLDGPPDDAPAETDEDLGTLNPEASDTEKNIDIRNAIESMSDTLRDDEDEAE